MSTSGDVVGVGSPPAAVRRPSRYESQKRRDWQTFTRYLCAHRPPLQLRRCSGAHVLEFLRYLDRFGKTRVHAPPCAAYGGGDGASAEAACQCPLRQAWGSLDALVGRLRAAFDERHGIDGGDGQASAGDGQASANPFAARAVRLYLRDVRDAQARASGISYTRKRKKKRGKQQGSCAPTKKQDGATTFMPAAAPPPPPYLAGVPFECCDYGSVLGLGGPTANGGAAAGFYMPLLFNTFG